MIRARWILLAALPGIFFTTDQLLAHHSFAAEYDAA
jgi:hypothetical protein